jgi:phosphoribosylaminoimidazole carboxylase (NCAIR synthetase)
LALLVTKAHKAHKVHRVSKERQALQVLQDRLVHKAQLVQLGLLGQQVHRVYKDQQAAQVLTFSLMLLACIQTGQHMILKLLALLI